MKQDQYIVDLPARVVGGFAPARGPGEGWMSFEWRTAEREGVGIGAGFGSGAAPLALELQLEGLHRLHLGVITYSSMRVWLDGDAGFHEFRCEHGGRQVQEVALPAADLSGKRLHIARSMLHERTFGGGLAYVRAEPVDARPVSARNVIGTNDGFSWIATQGMETVRDVRKQFVGLRDSDVFRIYWCPLGADVSGNHRTSVGNNPPFDPAQAWRGIDRTYAEVMNRVLGGGEDILAEAADAAWAHDVELHFYLRPEAFYCPFPLDGLWLSHFLRDNPQWRCRDEHGREIMRMSYAFPQVQDHMLAYVDELMGYDAGGVCLAFNRSLPMMVCEEPVLDAFEQRHGRRPRLPDEVDSPEMLAVRQDLLHDYLERLHARLAESGKTLSVIVAGDGASHMRLGLDIQRAVDAGLVEAVCVQGPAHQSAFWRELQSAGRTKVYPTPGAGAAVWEFEDYARQALETIHQPGFSGAFYWDIQSVHENPYNWHVARRAGSPAYLRDVAAGKVEPPRLASFTELRGVRLDRYDPGRSY